MGGKDDGDDEDRHYSHPRSHYDLNNKVMLTAIISLSLVVLLVAIFHLYARCTLRRRAQRRSALRELSLISTGSQINSVATPRRGLHQSVLASIPVFAYSDTESLECAVCLSSLKEGEMARALPNCKHVFHAECVDKWFASHSTCPICRTEAEPPPLIIRAEPREGVAAVHPTAPPLEVEGTSSTEGGQGSSSSSSKIGGSSRLRRMLSRERSLRRVQSCGQHHDDAAASDLEAQRD